MKDNENELSWGLNIQYDGRDIFQQLADIGRGGPRKKTRHEEWEEFSRKYICERVASIINEQRERDANGENPVFKGYASYEDYVLRNKREKAEEIERIKERFKLYRNDVDNQLKKDLTKLYAGAALEIGSAAIPMGVGGKVAGGLIKAIKPYLGRKISQEVGTGIVSGGLSGAVFGSGRGLIEDKNPLLISGQDALSGAVAGGSIGAATGKVGKTIAGDKLSNAIPYEKMTKSEQTVFKKDARKFYKDYIQDIYKVKNGKYISFGKKGIDETLRWYPYNAKNLPSLIKNFEKSKYITDEAPNHFRTDKISHFERYENADNKFLIAVNKDGSRKYYIDKTPSVNSLPTQSRGEFTDDANNIITDAKKKFNPSDLFRKFIDWIKR